MQSTGWMWIFSNKDLNEMVEIFKNRFLDLAKLYIPCKEITISDKDAPWMTPEVKCAIKRNKRIYNKWLKNGRKNDDKATINQV